jgi:hypothetical protein
MLLVDGTLAAAVGQGGCLCFVGGSGGGGVTFFDVIHDIQ